MINSLNFDLNDSWIKNQIRDLQPVPDTGIAISVIVGEKSVLNLTHGLRDRKNRLPITAKTLFQVGSATKAFTGLMFAMLEEERRLSLNSPININGTIIGFKDKDVEISITPLDILSHRSGIIANDLLWVLLEPTRSELLEKLQYLDQRPNSFRSSFIYNNILYMSLAKVMENYTNVEWEDLLNQKILAPLGMGQTTADFYNLIESDDRALPHFQEEQTEYFNAENIGPAGALISNLEDMSKWLKFHLMKTPSLISLKGRSSLYECYNTVRQPEGFVSQGLGWFGPQICYGMGWFTGNILGKKIVFHSGNVDGFSNLIIFVPEDQVGAVFLSNQSVSPFPGQMAQRIFSKIYGVDLKNSFELPSHGQGAPTSAPSQVQDDLRNYVGTYFNPAYGKIRVQIVDDALILSLSKHRWTTSMSDIKGSFTFMIKLFGGLLLPMSAIFSDDKKLLTIPFSLDAEAAPVRFIKE